MQTGLCTLLPVVWGFTVAFHSNSTLHKLVHRYDSAANDLLIHATVEIVLHHYAVFTSKQMYLRWENTSDLVGDILQRTAVHQTLLLESNPVPHPPEAGLDRLQQLRVHNLFVVEDYAGFRRVVDALNGELFDFSGLYTVLVADPTERGVETAGAILNTLWTMYIVNVAVLLATDGGDEAHLYTYFPYGQGYCEIALPVVWNIYLPDVGFVHRDRVIFPPKLNNFYECPMVVATFGVFPFIIPRPDGLELDGIEGILLRTLREQLNFRVQIVLVDPPDWGTAGPRDHATGVSSYIRQGRANLTIGYWATTLHRNQYMASTFAYYTSQLVLAVPPGIPYSSLELLRFPFSDRIWLVLFATLTIGLAVIGLLRKRAPKALQRLVLGPYPATAWMSMFDVLFGGSLGRTPSRNFARTLLINWIAATLVLRSAYTGSLYRFLRSGRHHSLPDNIPALLSAGYQPYMYRNYSFVFDAYPSVQRRIRLVTAFQFRNDTIHRLQEPDERVCVLLPIETVTFLNREISPLGQVLRISRGRVYVAKLAIYSQRSSPLVGPFNKVLELFCSSGLISHWAAHYHQVRFLASSNHRSRRQMGLSNLNGAFFLLLIGFALSLLAFMIEMLLKGRP